jgi:UDPglucose 6-dehydrogenase
VGDGGPIVKVCVYGLWHLGCVTAACLASGGHDVAGLDDDPTNVANLSSGHAPLSEPGLDALIQAGLDASRLSFTTEAEAAVEGADVVWITFDTPVDEDDRADVEYVTSRIVAAARHAKRGALIAVSSQLPVGSVRALEQAIGRTDLTFASLPENLRLGKAIEVFTRPDRVIAGIRDDQSRSTIGALLAPFTDRIEWMSVESAEMTKHALNAFLATSVVFINEIAVLCEAVGADAKEVERGLKSESRIGPRAYLSPGASFAGGTLARDIAFLTELGARSGRTPALISSVKTSNDAHKQWTRTKLQAVLGDLRGRSVAVWGLTYKPGTDTLRRSSSVELCRWLLSQGAQVRAHDPAVKIVPDDLPIRLCATAVDAAESVDAVVVATEWPEYRDLRPAGPMTVIDPNRFLREAFDQPGVRYVTIGRGTS